MSNQNKEKWLASLKKANNEYRETIKEAIRTSLFQLLKNKKFDSITISELVSRAGVSRSAFYRNYNSLNDVIKDEIQYVSNQVHKELSSSLYTNWKLIFETVEKCKNELQIIIEAKMESSLLDEMNSWYKKYPKEQKELFLICNGIVFNMIMVWQKGEIKSSLDDFIADLTKLMQPLLNKNASI